MASQIDQLFVTLKHWAVGHFPAEWQPLVAILLSIIPILAVFPALFAITTVIERKGLGRIQNRLGPNRVGPYGFLQFAADGIKALIKEDVVPRAADKVVHFLAPIALVVPVLLAYSVLPFGRNMVPIDLDAGLQQVLGQTRGLVPIREHLDIAVTGVIAVQNHYDCFSGHRPCLLNQLPHCGAAL
jgi:NADH-quinone oxidoreductase subunit H